MNIYQIVAQRIRARLVLIRHRRFAAQPLEIRGVWSAVRILSEQAELFRPTQRDQAPVKLERADIKGPYVPRQPVERTILPQQNPSAVGGVLMSERIRVLLWQY